MIRDWSNLIAFICDGDFVNSEVEVIRGEARRMREDYAVQDVELFRANTQVYYSMKPKIVTEKK